MAPGETLEIVRLLLKPLFGGLAIERESWWMFHAVKQEWPLDNFEMCRPEQQALLAERTFTYEVPQLDRWPELHENEQARYALLLVVLTDIEPLIAPFEVIEPLFKVAGLTNTSDADIVHWFLTSNRKVHHQ